jgi:hypothetical protein
MLLRKVGPLRSTRRWNRVELNLCDNLKFNRIFVSIAYASQWLAAQQTFGNSFSPLAQSLIWEILSRNVATTSSCVMI